MGKIEKKIKIVIETKTEKIVMKKIENIETKARVNTKSLVDQKTKTETVIKKRKETKKNRARVDLIRIKSQKSLVVSLRADVALKMKMKFQKIVKFARKRPTTMRKMILVREKHILITMKTIV